MYFLWLFSRVSTPGSWDLRERERERAEQSSTDLSAFTIAFHFSCLLCLCSLLSSLWFLYRLFALLPTLPLPLVYTALFVRSACVSKFIFLFVSTVNLMCLWHVLTVSSWRGYRRGYWQFMLTFFLYCISTIPWVSSPRLRLVTHVSGQAPTYHGVFVLS